MMMTLLWCYIVEQVSLLYIILKSTHKRKPFHTLLPCPGTYSNCWNWTQARVSWSSPLRYQIEPWVKVSQISTNKGHIAHDCITISPSVDPSSIMARITMFAPNHLNITSAKEGRTCSTVFQALHIWRWASYFTLLCEAGLTGQNPQLNQWMLPSSLTLPMPSHFHHLFVSQQHLSFLAAPSPNSLPCVHSTFGFGLKASENPWQIPRVHQTATSTCPCGHLSIYWWPSFF